MHSQQNPNLSNEQKKILFEKATEAPFTGELLHNDKQGEYLCANCGMLLFRSDKKFDSGTGWPSFSDIAKDGAITFSDDKSYGMTRTEITCSKCRGHLGHVFEDAVDQESGKRYCVNSLSLCFTPKKKH